MDELSISVVIPAYNHEQYLAEAIESAACREDVAEIVLVDDGSQDQSLALISSYAQRDPRIWILESGNQNLGTSARLNQLVEAAHFPVIAILNSDDVFADDRFSYIRPLLQSGIEFVTGGVDVLKEESGEVVSIRAGLEELPDQDHDLLENFDLSNPGDLLELLGYRNFLYTTSNFVFTKALWHRLGGFRRYHYCHDWDFAIRACLHGRAAYVDSRLTIYRNHAQNTIKAPWEDVKSEVQAMFERLVVEESALLRNEGFRTSLEENYFIEFEALANATSAP